MCKSDRKLHNTGFRDMKCCTYDKMCYYNVKGFLVIVLRVLFLVISREYQEIEYTVIADRIVLVGGDSGTGKTVL